MQRVACYAAQSVLTKSESPRAALQSLAQITERWLRAKGLPTLAPGTTTVPMREGRKTTVAAQWYYAGDTAFEWDITVEEPAQSGRVVTRVVLGVQKRQLHLFIELSVGTDGPQIAPMEFDASWPEVSRDLLSRRTWTVGRTPVSLGPIFWNGEEGAKRFVAVMEHRDRALPIVAVSDFERRPLTVPLPVELATDVCGIALVAHLDEAASRAVMRLRGREWSCADGAVRVYWPRSRTSGSAFDHPCWTRASLVAATGSEDAAAAGIRSEILKYLLELSTAAVDEPAALAAVREEALRRDFGYAKRAAAAEGKQGDFADEYFNRCVALEARLAERDATIKQLQDAVSHLKNPWHSILRFRGGGLAPAPEQPVKSVAEAIARARESYAAELSFGEHLESAVAALEPDTGPPDRIFETLRILAELCRSRREGSTATPLLDSLKREGLAVSDGDGAGAYGIDLHLDEELPADRWVWLDFRFDDAVNQVIVERVGRRA